MGYKNKAELISTQEYTTAPVIIGNNCWMGTNVVILKGVTIGDNVIVGANTTVYESIGSNKIIINNQDLLKRDW